MVDTERSTKLTTGHNKARQPMLLPEAGPVLGSACAAQDIQPYPLPPKQNPNHQVESDAMCQKQKFKLDD
jgi:hypothetical protein